MENPAIPPSPWDSRTTVPLLTPPPAGSTISRNHNGDRLLILGRRRWIESALGWIPTTYTGPRQ